MPFLDFLNLAQNSVCIDSFSQSKTAVLLKVSQLLSQDHPEIDSDVLFDAYWKREMLGSTAIGHGIIIPHIQTELVLKPRACFIKLQHAVDFGAEDKQPADLVVGLLFPQNQTEQHLEILAKIIKQFSIPQFRQECRCAENNEALYTLITKGVVAPLEYA